MAGFMIENILDGLVSQAQWSEALAAAEKVPAAVLLDTRTEGEFARGHVRAPSTSPSTSCAIVSTSSRVMVCCSRIVNRG